MDKARAILMRPGDNVATAVEAASPGAAVTFAVGGAAGSQTALDRIPFGHKIAVVDIAKGETIRKYGESIGAATSDIKAGQHVHVHNTESCRGRGDKN